MSQICSFAQLTCNFRMYAADIQTKTYFSFKIEDLPYSVYLVNDLKQREVADISNCFQSVLATFESSFYFLGQSNFLYGGKFK